MADNINRSTADNNATTNLQTETIAIKPIAPAIIPATNPYSSCSCTKILITQLFHEMKQEFPTVPDDIVWRYAMNNCHNRAACIKELRTQAEAYPGSVNVYPAALRQQTNKKHTASLRRLPSANCNNNNTMGANHSHGGGVESVQRLQTTTSPLTSSSPPTSAIKTNETNAKSDNNLNDTQSVSPQHAQRPNTLNFSSFDIRGRPTRTAPPPPLSASSSSLHTANTIAGQETFLTDAHADTPLNVSLNVIVSPVAGRPPMRPTRLAPAFGTDLPYDHGNNESRSLTTSRNGNENDTENGCCSNSHNHHHHHIHRSVQAISPGSSVRSVSVTLHQPNSVAVANSGHPMANETTKTVGNMEYFDASGGSAKVGLEITVGANGAPNVNRTPHIRPNNFYGAPEIANEAMERHAVPSPSLLNSDVRSGIPMSTNVMPSSEYTETVDHQLFCKQRLEEELNKELKRLEKINRELDVIRNPPKDGIRTLSEEIEQLRNNCNQMAKEVLEASPGYALGEVDETFYTNIYTGQRLPMQRNANIRLQQQQAAVSSVSSLLSPSALAVPPPPIPAALRSNLNRASPTSPAPISATSIQALHQPSTSATSHQYQPDDQLESGWICNMCTFQNHPLLNNCEQCEMPLLSAGKRNAVGSASPIIASPRMIHTGYVQYQTQPTRIHLPYQKQAAVTVGATSRLPPIVYAYAPP